MTKINYTEIEPEYRRRRRELAAKRATEAAAGQLSPAEYVKQADAAGDRVGPSMRLAAGYAQNDAAPDAANTNDTTED